MNERIAGGDGEHDIEAVASLAEPIRRSLYEHVVASAEPVSRDQAAAAVGVARQTAAYHLDRLVDDGLLGVEFRRLTGRVGPGAGRPSKLYHRSGTSYEISLPPRRYELAARILLEAVRDSDLDPEALAGAARRTGLVIGKEGLEAALTGTGYEPAEEGGETRFRNCPFHALRDRDRQTTCALNLALVDGIVEGAGVDTTAVLAPEDGYCCVRLRPAVM